MTEDSLRRAIETQKSIQEYAEELSLPDLRSVEEQLTELHEEAKRYGDDSPEWKWMRLEAATRLMTVQSIKRRRIASNAYEPLAKPTKQETLLAFQTLTPDQQERARDRARIHAEYWQRRDAGEGAKELQDELSEREAMSMSTLQKIISPRKV